jgi:hypothetical protein
MPEFTTTLVTDEAVRPFVDFLCDDVADVILRLVEREIDGDNEHLALSRFATAVVVAADRAGHCPSCLAKAVENLALEHENLNHLATPTSR